MRYLVDQALCSGHGNCADVGPDLHTLDEDGFNAAVGVEAEVAPGLEDQAHAAAGQCPDQAIRLIA